MWPASLARAWQLGTGPTVLAAVRTTPPLYLRQHTRVCASRGSRAPFACRRPQLAKRRAAKRTQGRACEASSASHAPLMLTYDKVGASWHSPSVPRMLCQCCSNCVPQQSAHTRACECETRRVDVCHTERTMAWDDCVRFRRCRHFERAQPPAPWRAIARDECMGHARRKHTSCCSASRRTSSVRSQRRAAMIPARTRACLPRLMGAALRTPPLTPPGCPLTRARVSLAMTRRVCGQHAPHGNASWRGHPI